MLEKTLENIRHFRSERLSNIANGNTPIALDEGSKTVLHVIPFKAFEAFSMLDISSLTDCRDEWFRPLYARDYGSVYNFEGFLTYAPVSSSTGRFASYLQIFRNGIIEAVDTAMLRITPDRKNIPSRSFEKNVFKGLKNYLLIQQELKVEAPVVLMLSLSGVSGYTMATDSEPRYEVHPIDKDYLLIPEIKIEAFECETAEVMRPIFDVIWNATGWQISMDYDETGKWIERA